MQVYFDNAATTRASKNVIDIVAKTMGEDFANPSSKHVMGVNAERFVKTAAEQIAATLKCKEKEIIFTSGGTESNNMVLIGGALANQRAGKHIITLGIEHASVYEPLLFLESLGYEITALPVDSKGRADLDALRNALRKDTIIVSTMMINNEVGAIEPVEEISKIVKDFAKVNGTKILYHVDAIQAYGKVKIFPHRMGIDALSVSGHKIHGPKGVGFLFLDENAKIKPIIYGGGQQKGMRSGTMNVPGIAGLGVAAKEAYESFDERIAKLNEIKDYIIDKVLELNNDDAIGGISINSQKGLEGAPHVVSISIENVRAEVMLHALEDKGIYVSSGSACSAHHPGISGTLKGMGIRENLLDSTIRISLSEDNTVEQAQYFIDTLKELIPVLRKFTRK